MSNRPLWKTLLAFGIVYFVWGSTYLAIRVGVREVPPLLFAALRFLIAGAALYGWTRMRREAAPRGRQWGSVVLLATLIFVCDYGLLFWAETKVPSGIAAVMLATIPVFIAIAEVVLLRTRRFTAALAVSLLVGLAGVGVLTLRTGSTGAGMSGSAISLTGALALGVAAISWSVASVLTRKLQLPESKMVSSGAQMLVGGLVLLPVSAAFGEWPRFHPTAVSMGAWAALVYLIIAGSIVGFTAYLWLIHHESPTKVGTYAYVNPVVAVALGHWLGGEELRVRTLLGTLLVLGSVGAIMAESKSDAAGITRVAREGVSANPSTESLRE
jgi:drug/metabolite transporter (DMT)-like permease